MKRAGHLVAAAVAAAVASAVSNAAGGLSEARADARYTGEALCIAPSVPLACTEDEGADREAVAAEGRFGPRRDWDCNPVGRLPYFAQWEAPWGNTPLGDKPLCRGADATAQAEEPDATCCMPYAASGCGPTTLAMVLRAYGEPVTPRTLGDLAVKAGLRHCNTNGVSPTAIMSTGKLPDYVLDDTLGSPLGPAPREGPKATERLERLESTVRSGRPVILACANCTVKNARGASKTFVGHYMVVTGVNDDGTFALLDPSGFDGRSIERSEVQRHASLQYIRRRDGATVRACQR
jgi:hypothetical protein